MAAPEAAVSSMKTALTGDPRGAHPAALGARGAMVPGGAPADAVPGAPYSVVYYYGAPPPAGGAPSALPGGAESHELAKLRARAGSGGARMCALEPPSLTRADRVDGDESGFVEADDIDPMAQEALSRLQLPDFNVPVSRRALTYVRFLTRTDRGRDLFETWLKRSGRYQDLVLEKLRERGLPEDLIWVAMIESGFDPRAKSPAGAVGLWQFMRPTGEVYGLEVTPHVDLRRDPVAATEAATHHLRDLFLRFGSWDLALAAYNMGYEQLLSAIDTTSTTDFNELARQRAIPSETASYVPKIVAAALVANNLERYGFADVTLNKPVSTAELSVPGSTPLATVAKAAGISTATLRTLNPHMLSSTAPPGGNWVLYLPSDALSRTRAALPALLERRGGSDALDPVDFLGTSEARRASKMRTWDEDESLLGALPKPKRRSLRSVLRGEPDVPTADDALAALADEFRADRRDRETVMYRVAAGDTLGAVARQFGVDAEDLARDNGIESQSRLREGALLRVMVDRGALDKWHKQLARGDEAPVGLGESRERPAARPESAERPSKKPSDRAEPARKARTKG